MKTPSAHLAALALGVASLFLSSCVHPYHTGSLRSAGYRTASPPLLSSALSRATSGAQVNSWMFRNTRHDPCSPNYHSGYSTTYYRTSYAPTYYTRHARPYYSNIGWGRPYYGSSWYGYPYTSQWRYPGYSRYQSYGSPLVSYGWPMSHFGGWSYIYRPTYWPTSNCYHRYGW